jgi:hypothetical protein
MQQSIQIISGPPRPVFVGGVIVVQKWSRYGYMVTAWIFLLAVLLQVFLAGLAIFSSSARWHTHVLFGQAMLLLVPLLIGFGLAGRIHGRVRWLGGLMIAIFIVQGGLPVLRDVAPWVAALHPVNALVLAWFSVTNAWAALGVVRGTVPAEKKSRRPSYAEQPAVGLAASAAPVVPVAPVAVDAVAATPVVDSTTALSQAELQPGVAAAMSEPDLPEAQRPAA